MKKTFLIIQMLICAIVCFAQKEVTILVSGEGKTKTEATDAALRSAIEQTFGAFVSTNTTILNDELVKDEIATVSSGNIEKYTEVNYFERNGKSYITLNATISIGKLVSYAKSKGSSCELDGATFTAEIRKLNFYRENTIKALENLREQLKVLALDVFDVQLSKPNITASGEVSVTVEIYSNENMYKYEQLILTTLKQLAIPEKEIKHLDEIDAYYTSVTCMPLSIKTYPNGKNEIWLDKDHTKKFYLYTFFNPESLDGNFNEFRENIFTDVLRNIKIVDNLGYKLYAERDSFFNPYDYKNDYEQPAYHFVYLQKPSYPRGYCFFYDANKIRTKKNRFLGHWPLELSDLISSGSKYIFSRRYDLETLSRITGFTVERGEYGF